MAFTVTISVSLVPEGEYRFSVPLAPPSGPRQPVSSIPKEDKVLPLGSSTLSPGLSVPLAS